MKYNILNIFNKSYIEKKQEIQFNIKIISEICNFSGKVIFQDCILKRYHYKQIYLLSYLKFFSLKPKMPVKFEINPHDSLLKLRIS